ncbi:MAG TPA: outer membrane beta-barrel protein [Vicinamibacterales bacterium]|nr:outer membrane beta-barrel protein [Vicinamibacterales bacterium]
MRGAIKILVMTAAVALAPAIASAQSYGYVVPWASANGGSGFDNGRAGVGIGAGGMGDGIVGGEVDFGYSPSFFGTQTDFGNNTVINLMGNLIVGAPLGRTLGANVTPYGTFGLGLLRTQIDGGTIARVSSSNNMFGWDAGGGLMGFFNEHVGLRGDVRYLRGFENTNTGVTTIDLNGNGQLHFWRAAIGVVIR